MGKPSLQRIQIRVSILIWDIKNSKAIYEGHSQEMGNLKTELNKIPLCSGRFVKGPLQHPRLEPKNKCFSFADEKFDAPSFQSSIMLLNLPDMLKDKITKTYIPH